MKKSIIAILITILILVQLLILDNYLQTKAHNKNSSYSANQITVVDKPAIPTNSAPSKIPVLMYHAIDYGNNSLYVSKVDFENQISYLVKNNYNFITFEDLANNNIPSNPIIITFDDGYHDLYTNAFPILKKYNVRATAFLIIEDLHLTGEEIAQMNQWFSFQSHTLYHKDLTTLDNNSLENELDLSKKMLQSIVSNKVIAICYPSGKFNNNVINIAKKHYSYGVTTISGSYSTKNDLYKIPRIRISKSDNLKDFENKLNSK